MTQLNALPRGGRMGVALMTLLVAACGGTDGPKPYPVKGTLLVNGQPAAGATIAFYATQPFGKTIIPTALTAEDGSFAVTTFKAKDGAPAGEYEVTVTWPEFRKGWQVGEDRLNRAFANPKTSGLKVQVEKGDNELPPFELTATLRAVTPKVRKGGKDPQH